jgi:hypothetical protein
MTMHNPTTFHEELEEIMEMMQDEDMTVGDRLDVAISLAGLLLLRIDDLQGFAVSKGLSDKDFQRYMDGMQNVTYH